MTPTQSPRPANPGSMREGAPALVSPKSAGAPTATRPRLTGTRPMGSQQDYEFLCQALDAYTDAPKAVRFVAYERLRQAALCCGMAADEPPLTWSNAEVRKYRAGQPNTNERRA